MYGSSIINFDNNEYSVGSWIHIEGGAVQSTPGRGYVATGEGLSEITLPPTSSKGDVIEIVADGTGGWKLKQNAGQTISFLGQNTTIGVSGYLASTSIGDSVELRCVEANVRWRVMDSNGNIEII